MLVLRNRRPEWMPSPRTLGDRVFAVAVVRRDGIVGDEGEVSLVTGGCVLSLICLPVPGDAPTMTDNNCQENACPS